MRCLLQIFFTGDGRFGSVQIVEENCFGKENEKMMPGATLKRWMILYVASGGFGFNTEDMLHVKWPVAPPSIQEYTMWMSHEAGLWHETAE